MNYIIHIYNLFLKLLALIRYWQWQEKMQIIAVSVLLLFLFNQERVSLYVAINAFYIFLYTALILSYGYLINSYADRKADAKVGKDYYLDFSENFIKKTAIFLGVCTLIFPILFFNVYIIGISFILFLLATYYSLEPIRFKRRNFLGIIVASMQKTPFLFFLFFTSQAYTVLFLFGWILIISFIIEIAHQISDFENDKKTNINTYVVAYGINNARNVILILSVILIAYILSVFIIFDMSISVLGVLVLFIFSHNAIYYAGNILSKYKKNIKKQQ